MGFSVVGYYVTMASMRSVILVRHGLSEGMFGNIVGRSGRRYAMKPRWENKCMIMR